MEKEKISSPYESEKTLEKQEKISLSELPKIIRGLTQEKKWRVGLNIYCGNGENIEKFLIIGGIPPEKVKEVLGTFAKAYDSYHKELNTNQYLSSVESDKTSISQETSEMTIEAGKTREKGAENLDKKWDEWQWFTFARLEGGKNWEEATKE